MIFEIACMAMGGFTVAAKKNPAVYTAGRYQLPMKTN
jgi:hypothetical protein